MNRLEAARDATRRATYRWWLLWLTAAGVIALVQWVTP